jgi:hypothetical protein
LICSGET